MIYLDWNASAPLAAPAKAVWLAVQEQSWGNPSSVHAIGQRARHTADVAKATTARLLGCKPHELIATSGGTEANALAIHAAGPGPIVCTAICHSSVLRNAEQAGPVVRSPVDGTGRVQLIVAPDTRLVCFQLANNELGTLQDVPALVAQVRASAPGAWIHLDACQGAGKIPCTFAAWGVDSVALTGHKIGAPVGIGLLYVRSGHKVVPLLRGGRQQQDRRSGTEDAAGLAALAAALTAAVEHQASESLRQGTLLAEAFARIQAARPRAVWLGQDAPRLANTLALGLPGLANEVLVQRLDLRGICVSTGAACMAARGEPSHVVAALGVPRDLARSVIRVSIGPGTTAADLHAFTDAYLAETKDFPCA